MLHFSLLLCFVLRWRLVLGDVFIQEPSAGNTYDANGNMTFSVTDDDDTPSMTDLGPFLSGTPKRDIVFWDKQSKQNVSIPTLYNDTNLLAAGKELQDPDQKINHRLWLRVPFARKLLSFRSPSQSDFLISLNLRLPTSPHYIASLLHPWIYIQQAGGIDRQSTHVQYNLEHHRLRRAPLQTLSTKNSSSIYNIELDARSRIMGPISKPFRRRNKHQNQHNTPAHLPNIMAVHPRTHKQLSSRLLQHIFYMDPSVSAIIDFGSILHTLCVKVNGHQLLPLDCTTAKADISPYLVVRENAVVAVAAITHFNVLRLILGQIQTAGFG